MTTSTSPRPPLPPFDRDAAIQKVRLAEDAWNTRDPARVATGYTPDSVWRNRAEFLAGREAIVQFLARKWARELDYRLIKELWAFHENRIAVRFAYEWRDDSGHWFRSCGNKLGVRRERSHGSADREHQRSADPRGGSPVSVASRPSGRSSRSLRSGLVGSNLASLSLR